MKIVLTLVAVSACLFLVGWNGPGVADDSAAVERAVLDYLEGIYDCKPELIERSVHPELAKYGFWRKDARGEYRGRGMTFEQLTELSKDYNKDGHIPADAPRTVVILDLLDQTAAAKLTAEWGIDYMHLARFDGKWQITQVLWQSHPAASQP